MDPKDQLQAQHFRERSIPARRHQAPSVLDILEARATISSCVMLRSPEPPSSSSPSPEPSQHPNLHPSVESSSSLRLNLELPNTLLPILRQLSCFPPSRPGDVELSISSWSLPQTTGSLEPRLTTWSCVIIRSLEPLSPMFPSFKLPIFLHHSLEPPSSRHPSLEPSVSLLLNLEPPISLHPSLKLPSSLPPSREPSGSLHLNMEPPISLHPSVEPSSSFVSGWNC